MFWRFSGFGISRDDIRHVLETGETIREYPDDKPFPKYIVLGWTEEGCPIHVVAADDESNGVTCVITVYEPDPGIWTDDFRERKDN